MRGSFLLAMLTVLVSNPDEYIAEMTVPMAQMLGDDTVILNYGEPQFRSQLEALITAMCDNVGRLGPRLYKTQLAALLPLTVHGGAWLMATHPGFIDILALHLRNENFTTCEQTWAFLRSFTRQAPVLELVLGNQKISALLAALPNQTNRFVFLHIAHFCFDIWEEREVNLKKLLCDIMKPAIGGIVCFYRARSATLASDTTVRRALKSLIRVVRTLKNTPETEDFAITFHKHEQVTG
jgi:hypothetical protein